MHRMPCQAQRTVGYVLDDTEKRVVPQGVHLLLDLFISFRFSVFLLYLGFHFLKIVGLKQGDSIVYPLGPVEFSCFSFPFRTRYMWVPVIKETWNWKNKATGHQSINKARDSLLMYPEREPNLDSLVARLGLYVYARPYLESSIFTSFV